MNDDNFDYIKTLTDSRIRARSEGLVGFEKHYRAVSRYMNMVLSASDLENWNKKHHGGRLRLLDLVILEKMPIFIFEGDVGTGKTATAEGIANRFVQEMKRDGCILKLSNRIRGRGLHGEMSRLIRDSFQRLKKEAGDKKLAFMLVDEADSLVSQRSMEQMHQEEKAAVNTIIQELDNLRGLEGRVAVFFCTNHPEMLDQAVVRRAISRLEFTRPNVENRLELLKHDLKGLDLAENQLKELAGLSGPNDERAGPGYTYSDFRLRLYPEALSRCFPGKPLTFDTLAEAICDTLPSPEVK